MDSREEEITLGVENVVGEGGVDIADEGEEGHLKVLLRSTVVLHLLPVASIVWRILGTMIPIQSD